MSLLRFGSSDLLNPLGFYIIAAGDGTTIVNHLS